MSGVMAGLIFSSIGYYVTRFGFKNGNYVEATIGMALMLYSYFTHTPIQDWGIGTLLCGAAYYFRAG